MQNQLPLIKERSAKRKPGRPASLSRRDFEILKYIWRWKVASTASIHMATNRECSPYSTYKILTKLELANFVRSEMHLVECFYVWQLTEKGFLAIRGYLGDLCEDGFLSENHRHDRLVQAFQLGEWAGINPRHVIHFTEQELRRKPVEQYPEWLPQTKEHRPDGYTRFLGQKRSWTFAYEVELSPKSLQKYEAILRFYKMSRNVDRVVWLVAGPEIKQIILRAKACIRDESSNYHVFVDLEEFLVNGWDASVTNERSENLFTLREKYREMSGETLGELLGKPRELARVTEHLDSRKVIGKSRP